MNDLWSRSSLAIAPLHCKSQCCKSACQISTAGLSVWHAGMRLPGLSVIEAPSSVLGGAVPLMSTPPCRCYPRHTRSLYGGTWIEMPASFVMAFVTRAMCFSRRVQLLLIVIAAGVSASAETQTDISYSPILQRNEWVLTDMLYRSNTIEMSQCWNVLVPECPNTLAPVPYCPKTLFHWCRNVSGLNCLGSDVSVSLPGTSYFRKQQQKLLGR